MPSPEQLKELQKLLPQVATPETVLAVIDGKAIAAEDLIGELNKMPTADISSLIDDLKTLDKLGYPTNWPKCPACGQPILSRSGLSRRRCQS